MKSETEKHIVLVDTDYFFDGPESEADQETALATMIELCEAEYPQAKAVYDMPASEMESFIRAGNYRASEVVHADDDLYQSAWDLAEDSDD